jgi:hypothetical protein
MANRAYASFWIRDYSEQVMLERFQQFLETVPLSETASGFTSLVIRAISPSEVPLIEHDLRDTGSKPADLIALARENENADSAYEVEGSWDLWHWDIQAGLWKRGPEPLLLICQGQAYDDGAASTSGDFLADVGLEHLYTGHGRLLGSSEPRSAPPEADPIEADFLTLMSKEENLDEYHRKTRENIQQLMRWVQTVEQALPIERFTLWSEGEENLEARLDEILAVH